MAKRSEPDYVSGKKGRYEIAPPVEHPPFCVCELCPKHRAAAAAKILAIAIRDGFELTEREAIERAWAEPLSIRARRRNLPKAARSSRPAATTFAANFKRCEEVRLVEAVRAAERKKQARASAVPFGRICDAYRAHLQAEGKRYDRDRYRIDAIEAFFGRGRDVASLEREAFETLKAHLAMAGAAPATINRYATVLVAMANNAVRDGIIAGHRLANLKRPTQKRMRKPVTFTRRQVEILLGAAMDQFERERAEYQREWDLGQEARRRAGMTLRTKGAPSQAPLRGFCLVAYLTLMRPSNNFALLWSQVRLDADRDVGRFRLDDHKNSSKGVEVEAALHPRLVRYFRQIHPGPGAVGYVHANPQTGEPYKNLRRQWETLTAITNRMLGPGEQLTGERLHFYCWRHTGASELAANGADPVMIVRMMGDTSLKTVMDHYFDSSIEHMAAVMERWAPEIETSIETKEEREWTTN